MPSLDDLVNLDELLKVLGQRQIISIMVEAARRSSARYSSTILVDKVLVFVAPIIIGGTAPRIRSKGKGVEKVAQAPAPRSE